MEVITHAMRRERWKAIIKECNESGMKKKDWLEQNGINPKLFYRWQQKLRMEIGAELVLAQSNAVSAVHSMPDFCPLTQPDSCRETTAVIRAGNVSVEISEDIPDDFLIRLMRAAANV